MTGLAGDIVRVGGLCGILELRTESCAGFIIALPVALRESSGDYCVPRLSVMNFIFCLVRDIISPGQKRQRLIRESVTALDPPRIHPPMNALDC